MIIVFDSTDSYDFKSARYHEQSRKLIIPKEVYSWTGADGNFDGFIVYDVNVTGSEPIETSYEISHVLSEDISSTCNTSAIMPARSFVFESKLTTILSHSVIVTDLETGANLWTYNLEDRSNSINCLNYAEV